MNMGLFYYSLRVEIRVVIPFAKVSSFRFLNLVLRKLTVRPLLAQISKVFKLDNILFPCLCIITSHIFPKSCGSVLFQMKEQTFQVEILNKLQL